MIIFNSEQEVEECPSTKPESRAREAGPAQEGFEEDLEVTGLENAPE